MFFDEYNVLHNFINQNKEFFNFSKTIINNNEIENKTNHQKGNNYNFNLKINGTNNNFDVKQKTNEIINNAKDMDIKGIIGNVKTIIEKKAHELANPKSTKTYKHNPVKHSSCDRLILDVSYPKMYFRNDYNIKKNRLKYVDF